MMSERTSQNDEPIAIIGFAFEFGGEATSEDGFWDMLVNGRTASSAIPRDRFNASAFYHPDTNRLDRLPICSGNFLTANPAAFDAPFFNIKPDEAAAMDPQSRKLLESTYHALENAGLPLDQVAGTKTCVFTGVSADDYRLMYFKDPTHSIRHAATGMAMSMLANKISWFYDFKGPSVQLDTACSASLTAIHLAVRSLQSKESDMGVVGAADIYLTPESLAPLAHLGFFSPDGKCYSFDSRANGYVRGDGYGVLVLKRLSDALVNGDSIRAVIRGTSANENGRTVGGITKVNFDAQHALIREAYNSANLDPSLTRYVEAHAPGTEGDVVETSALGSFFSKHRSPKSPLYMGSVKANLGHLEGTSGIASLVKVILMLERGVICKLANFQALHPGIRAVDSDMAFPTENVQWPRGIRQASINSFGFGGANAHVVLQNFEATTREHQAAFKQSPTRILVWSAADEQGCHRILAALDKLQKRSRSSWDNDFISALAYTLANRRTRLAWKVSLTLSNDNTAHSRLALKQSIKPLRTLSTPPLVFVFTGQGAQWAAMGTQFLDNPVFRSAVQAFSDDLKSLGATWSVEDELRVNAGARHLNSPVVSQVVCTAIQVAMVDMLRNFDVRPTYVIGHSSGEIAAAYCSGAISSRSACKLAYYRGQLVQEAFQSGQHGMLVVGLSEQSLLRHLQTYARRANAAQIFIACINSPRNVTLSGDLEQLRDFKATLEADSTFVRELDVPVPYHSPLLYPLVSQYESLLGVIDPGLRDAASPQMISTVEGCSISPDDTCTPQYWSKNLTSLVKFSQGLSTLVGKVVPPYKKAPLPVFLEVGPYGALRTPIKDTINTTHPLREYHYLTVMEKGHLTDTRLYDSLGTLHTLNLPLDLNAINGITPEKMETLTTLPRYPFNHTNTYWHESRTSYAHRMRRHPRHDFLGWRNLEWNPLFAKWRIQLRTLENPWIVDHRIGGALIYPGAGMLVMALEAAKQYVEDFERRQITGYSFRDVTFPSVLPVSQAGGQTEVEVMLMVDPETIDGRKRHTRFEYVVMILEDKEAWRKTCQGQIAVEFEEEEVILGAVEEERFETDELLRKFHHRKDLCHRSIPRQKLYDRLKTVGLDLGPSFQVFDNIMIGSSQAGVATADIRLRHWTINRDHLDHVSPHVIHPTALDGAIQLLIVALGAASRRKLHTRVPSAINYLWIDARGLKNAERLTAVAKSEFVGLRNTSTEVLAVDTRTDKLKIHIQGLEAVTIKSANGPLANRERITTFNVGWSTLDLLDRTQKDESEIRVQLMITQTNDNSAELSTLAAHVENEFRNHGIPHVPVCSWSKSHPLMGGDIVDIVVLFEETGEDHQTQSQLVFDMWKHLITASRSITWITMCTSSTSSAAHDIVVGLVRSLRIEYRDHKLSTINMALPPDSLDYDQRALLLLRALQLNKASGAVHEPEITISLVDGCPCFLTPRLIPSEILANHLSINDISESKMISRPSFHSQTNAPALTLNILSPGLLDSLAFQYDPVPSTRAVKPNEVVVRPSYVGLNFLDILTALGRIPNNAVLGIEASGTVLQLGADVSSMKVGDRVACLTDGTFKTHVRADYRNVIRLPEAVSCRDAASLVGTAATVVRSLVQVARLEKAETVLIHAGAGATGQMAIQLATFLGAKIFVTVGSEKKRRLLKDAYGIPAERVGNSRDGSFAKKILRLTGGRGVNVVLNSLTGELLECGWRDVVAPFGRWVDLSKADMIQNRALSMRPFLKNVTFACVDLSGIWRETPALMQRLLTEVFHLVEVGVFRPPTPVAEFAVDQIQAAFRCVQSGEDGGKVIVNMDSDLPVSVRTDFGSEWHLCNDRTYVIAGGFGGLGQEVSRWMVARGAKYLLILSRSGIEHETERQCLVTELEEAGCHVVVGVCDVSDRSALNCVLQGLPPTMPPIAGCIQACMVLSDGYFANMLPDNWTRSTAPKVAGTQNLDELLPLSLDFFVILSSLVGTIGSEGQSNYAAGNCFQDGLAKSRVLRGEKAISINLGMIVDEGAVAADQDLARTMKSFGHYQDMTMADVERLLNYYCDPSTPLLSPQECHLVCGIRPPAILTARGFKHPDWMKRPMFESLATIRITENHSEPEQGKANLQRILTDSTSIADATEVIAASILEKLSESLSIAKNDIDPGRPIHFYGVDSLVAVEMRNWLANTLGADIAVLHILGNTSTEKLGMITAESSIYTAHLRPT